MANSKFELENSGIRAVVTDSDAPVRRDMQNRLRRIQRRARRNVGKNTGALSASISTRTYMRGDVLHGEVYSNMSYALPHHEGTRPHIIVPQRAEMLRFKVGGKIVYANQVMHPGTRPNRFLANALREVER